MLHLVEGLANLDTHLLWPHSIHQDHLRVLLDLLQEILQVEAKLRVATKGLLMKEVIMQVEDKVMEHQEEVIHQAKMPTEIEKTLTAEGRDPPAQEMTAIAEKIG